MADLSASGEKYPHFFMSGGALTVRCLECEKWVEHCLVMKYGPHLFTKFGYCKTHGGLARAEILAVKCMESGEPIPVRNTVDTTTQFKHPPDLKDYT